MSETISESVKSEIFASPTVEGGPLPIVMYNALRQSPLHSKYFHGYELGPLKYPVCSMLQTI